MATNGKGDVYKMNNLKGLYKNISKTIVMGNKIINDECFRHRHKSKIINN